VEVEEMALAVVEVLVMAAAVVMAGRHRK